MFKDRRSRRAWRTFRLRTEIMLGSVSRATRAEVMCDLEEHIRDALQQDSAQDEFEQVSAILDRMGDPRDFLKPLLADAVLRQPASPSLWATLQAPVVAARKGTWALAQALGNGCVAMLGAGAALMGAMRLFAPLSAGVFQMGEDNFQVRIVGSALAAGVQIFPAWLAVAVIAAGFAMMVWSIRSLRAMLVRLLLL